MRLWWLHKTEIWNWNDGVMLTVLTFQQTKLRERERERERYSYYQNRIFSCLEVKNGNSQSPEVKTKIEIPNSHDNFDVHNCHCIAFPVFLYGFHQWVFIQLFQNPFKKECKATLPPWQVFVLGWPNRLPWKALRHMWRLGSSRI